MLLHANPSSRSGPFPGIDHSIVTHAQHVIRIAGMLKLTSSKPPCVHSGRILIQSGTTYLARVPDAEIGHGAWGGGDIGRRSDDAARIRRLHAGQHEPIAEDPPLQVQVGPRVGGRGACAGHAASAWSA